MAAVISTGFLTVVYFFLKGASPVIFYIVIFLIGLPMGGLWTIFVTTASEMFGTNIRATVTTTAPNFVRGATVLIILYLELLKPSLGLWAAAFIVGGTCIILAFFAILGMSETYHRHLDFTEE